MPTNTLPVDILAVAVVIISPLDEINPPVNKLPPVMLPVPLTTPAPNSTLPPVMLPVPLTTPEPNMTLPPVMFAVTAKLPRVPTEVIFVCEAVCKVPVRLVANTLPVPLTTPAPNSTLPPITLPETLTVVPV